MDTQMPPPSGGTDKTPRTERGRKTRRKLLDAAAREFGEKGYHEASIASITRRAGIALGSFYTYFDSKEALFKALVTDLSSRVKEGAGKVVGAAQNEAIERGESVNPMQIERAILHAFLQFAHDNKEIYRIIDESEFVDPESYRRHYQGAADRILDRLRQGASAGALRDDVNEVFAWVLMGANVFLGLRYAVWDSDDSLEEVANMANMLLSDGLKRRE